MRGTPLSDTFACRGVSPADPRGGLCHRRHRYGFV